MMNIAILSSLLMSCFTSGKGNHLTNRPNFNSLFAGFHSDDVKLNRPIGSSSFITKNEQSYENHVTQNIQDFTNELNYHLAAENKLFGPHNRKLMPPAVGSKRLTIAAFQNPFLPTEPSTIISDIPSNKDAHGTPNMADNHENGQLNDTIIENLKQISLSKNKFAVPQLAKLLLSFLLGKKFNGGEMEDGAFNVLLPASNLPKNDEKLPNFNQFNQFYPINQRNDQAIDSTRQLKADRVESDIGDIKDNDVRQINAKTVQNNIKLKEELRKLKEARKKQETVLKKLKREKRSIADFKLESVTNVPEKDNYSNRRLDKNTARILNKISLSMSTTDVEELSRLLVTFLLRSNLFGGISPYRKRKLDENVILQKEQNIFGPKINSNSLTRPMDAQQINSDAVKMDRKTSRQHMIDKFQNQVHKRSIVDFEKELDKGPNSKVDAFPLSMRTKQNQGKQKLTRERSILDFDPIANDIIVDNFPLSVRAQEKEENFPITAKNNEFKADEIKLQSHGDEKVEKVVDGFPNSERTEDKGNKAAEISEQGHKKDLIREKSKQSEEVVDSFPFMERTEKKSNRKKQSGDVKKNRKYYHRLEKSNDKQYEIVVDKFPIPSKVKHKKLEIREDRSKEFQHHNSHKYEESYEKKGRNERHKILMPFPNSDMVQEETYENSDINETDKGIISIKVSNTDENAPSNITVPFSSGKLVEEDPFLGSEEKEENLDTSKFTKIKETVTPSEHEYLVASIKDLIRRKIDYEIEKKMRTKRQIVDFGLFRDGNSDHKFGKRKENLMRITKFPHTERTEGVITGLGFVENHQRHKKTCTCEERRGKHGKKKMRRKGKKNHHYANLHF